MDLCARYICIDPRANPRERKESMDGRMALLPAELCKGTVTFKEFYLFVRSEINCSNDLKFWIICEQSYKDNIQMLDFKRIYKDFFSSKAPYPVAVSEITVESFKICLELSAEPAQLQRLLRLAQMEAHKLLKINSSDLSCMYCLVMNFIRLNYEIDHNLVMPVTTAWKCFSAKLQISWRK